jgi:glutaredoxin-related protein
MQIQQQRQEHESGIMKLRDEKAAFEEMQREKYIANQSKLD